MELALQYQKEKNIAIYPWLVGETSSTGTYSKFDMAMFGAKYPTTPSPTSKNTVQQTISALFKFQCSFMEAARLSKDELENIVSYCDEEAWTVKSKSPNALKVRTGHFIAK